MTHAFRIEVSRIRMFMCDRKKTSIVVSNERYQLSGAVVHAVADRYKLVTRRKGIFEAGTQKIVKSKSDRKSVV